MMKIRNDCRRQHMGTVCLCIFLMTGGIEWAEASEGGRLRPDRNTAVITPSKQNPDSFKSGVDAGVSHTQALAGSLNVFENNPPELCAGHGMLSSISLTDWKSGLGSWVVGTHDIANPDTFDTPDWEVVRSLPDSRPGKAAFVSNIDSGNCWTDDESGALTLDSPPIEIPAGTMVPRISVDHWVATEFGYDGGNIKISVNGGEFNLIPASAIDFSPYNSTLISTLDGNTNPLAGESAFTGTDSGGLTGSWGQSHITLFGIANAGDTIQLRFDFGVDGCDGLIGWYVDDIEVYSCSAELPPSNCGNSVIDAGEQCDDGNTFIDDGCSNTCQVDDGWQCTDPTPPAEIADAGFEAGTPNPFWAEASTNFDTPICDEENCGTGTGSGPADGAFWAWFGGIEEFEESSVSQSLVFPATVSTLQFELEVSACDSASDYVELLIDGSQKLIIDGSSPLCGLSGYTTQSVDISAFADGSVHAIEFHSESFAVNLDFSNFFIDSISIPGNASFCSLISTSLTLQKEVINDSGGSASASDWTLTASGPSGFSGSGPSVSNGADFAAGSYDLSESGGPAGYSASDWVCMGGTQDDADTITLALGDITTCTIRNDDIAPTLTVVKTIINNSGGAITDENAFGLKVDGGEVQHNASNAFNVGSHTVSEDGLTGYQPGSWSGDCDPDGSITLTLAQVATCTISNDDISPTLTVIKTIINDNGGTITDANAFGLKVDGGSVLHNASNSFVAGNHTVSEEGLPGYQAGSWGGDCNPDGSITLALGQAATCTISNDDMSSMLTVVKTIINDNGGTVTNEDAFGLKVDGGSVLHNVLTTIDAGNHTVSEDGLPGYQPGTWGGDCNPDGTITLAPGQDATCTITNDDSGGTGLTLVKKVINDNGGSALGSAWNLNAIGPTPFGGKGPNVSSGSDFAAGSYDLSESGGPNGYIASDWECVGGTQNDGDTITLALGETATCTISNDDISPTLTVVKTIVNNNGGTVTEPDAFGLKVDGIGVLNNAINAVDAGIRSVSEDGLPGYQPGAWGGDCDPDGSITLTLGEAATCTISNDDVSPTLTVIKTIVNNNGGTVTDPDTFGLKVDGGSVLHNIRNAFDAGNHTVSEGGLPGYQPGSWGGDCNPDGSITLAPGQDATCTISNDDISPTLTVVKTITNDNGGTITDENAFGLKVDGGDVQHNARNTFNVGSHTVSEDGLPGYQPGNWGGDCNPDGIITLSLGEAATCTISNDDISPTLTVVKTIVNDNGGTVTAEDAFGLKVDGSNVQHNTSNAFDAGNHTVSEDGLPGYQPASWGGDCNPDGSITLALGETATCTISNDDISPTLTVLKTIINDNGGTITNPKAFGLRVDGGSVLHNARNAFDAGNHTVSEDGLDGYQPGKWGGDCNPDGSIMLTLDQDAICTITNDDIDINEVIFSNGFEFN